MKTGAALLLSLACVAAATGSLASEKPPQFWNLTTSTVTRLEISKAGENAYGSNQTVNDPDGTVDHDERLKIIGVASGVYDLRLSLKDGRTCFARNVSILQGKPFSSRRQEPRGLLKTVKRRVVNRSQISRRDARRATLPRREKTEQFSKVGL